MSDEDKTNQEPNLTDKQRIFIAEYLVDKNGTRAARAAGYTGNDNVLGVTAYDLLRLPKIKTIIDERLNAVEDKCGITVEWILSSLKEVAERCMQKKAVMKFDYKEKEMVQEEDEDGNVLFTFDSRGANKALELLGKTKRMFIDKVEVTDDTNMSELIKAARERYNGKNE